MTVRDDILGAVYVERDYQDDNYPSKVSLGDVLALIDVYVIKAKVDFAEGDEFQVGRRLIQIAALAARGIEDNVES